MTSPGMCRDIAHLIAETASYRQLDLHENHFLALTPNCTPDERMAIAMELPAWAQRRMNLFGDGNPHQPPFTWPQARQAPLRTEATG